MLILFLERIQYDICGTLYPTCEPFEYVMVLIDASTRWVTCMFIIKLQPDICEITCLIDLIKEHNFMIIQL